MQRGPLVAGGLACDREPCELVAEGDRVSLGAKHPRRKSLAEVLELVAGDGLQQP